MSLAGNEEDAAVEESWVFSLGKEQEGLRL